MEIKITHHSIEKQLMQLRISLFYDTDHLSDSWFNAEILGGLNGADVEFVDLPTNDSEYGIVAVHLTTRTGSVILD